MKLFHKQKNKESMGGMLNPKKLFNPLYQFDKEKKAKAIAFVDYEHWFYSYRKLYHLKPDVIEWRKQLEENYCLEDVMVFADFSYKEIRDELTKIRCVTNSIIETQQTMTNSKKDMTDFIMLDYIYQYVSEHPKTNTYILFTGDAHFQSVIKYLIQKCGKKVIVYGVKDAFSNQLKQIASNWFELPASEDILKGLYPLIVNNMAYVAGKNRIVPTFNATARALSKQNDVSEQLIKAALVEMINKGLLYTQKYRVEFNRSVNVLAANWEALVKEGLWSY